MKFIIPDHALEALKHSQNATGEDKRSYLYDFAYSVIRFNQKALLEPQIARAYAELEIPSDATNRPERIEARLNPSLSNTDFTTLEISEFSEARDAANDFYEKKIKTIIPTQEAWRVNRDAAVKFAELFTALLETSSVKKFQVGDRVKLVGTQNLTFTHHNHTRELHTDFRDSTETGFIEKIDSSFPETLYKFRSVGRNNGKHFKACNLELTI